jgi:hypothetical protein
MHTNVLLESLKIRGHFEGLAAKKCDGFKWVRIRSNGMTM